MATQEWTLEPITANVGYRYSVRTSGGRRVAAIVNASTDDNEPRMEQEAHLIAAAPAMLEALRDLEFSLEECAAVPTCFMTDHCPYCRRNKHNIEGIGHADGCIIAAAIEAATSEGD